MLNSEAVPTRYEHVESLVAQLDQIASLLRQLLKKDVLLSILGLWVVIVSILLFVSLFA